MITIETSVREEIQSFLDSTGLTVNKLCVLAGVFPSSVYPLLKGRRNYLRADTYKKIKAVVDTISKASNV